MLTLDIPGRKPVEAEHLVLDYNGTLAVDGCIIQGVADRLKKLSSVIRVHVLTADTFGTAEKELSSGLFRISSGTTEDAAKCEFG